MAAAAKAGPTDVHLELGGKSAMIVFDDVEEVEAAVDWACVGIFSNSGQVCRRVLIVLLIVWSCSRPEKTRKKRNGVQVPEAGTTTPFWPDFFQSPITLRHNK